MFCAARRVVRNAKQKKTVPAKNSEANFWRPRFTWPLRAGKRANANFACSEGFFLSGAPRRLPGLAAFSKPAAVWPVGFCAWCFGVFSASAAYARGFFGTVCPVCLPCALCAHFSLIFYLSCLAVASQISFHLSLRPRRALPRLSPPAALFPACGSCHLLLFRGLLHPLPVCLFCVVYAGFLSLVFLPFPA